MASQARDAIWGRIRVTVETTVHNPAKCWSAVNCRQEITGEEVLPCVLSILHLLSAI
jgi:hypothetical protein